MVKFKEIFPRLQQSDCSIDGTQRSRIAEVPEIEFPSLGRSAKVK
jgi:hypothetical protein